MERPCSFPTTDHPTGECKALVEGFGRGGTYRNCEDYCTMLVTEAAPQGRVCVNAFEDKSDSCNIKEMDELKGNGTSNCAFQIASSDIICECGNPRSVGVLDAKIEALARKVRALQAH